VYKTRIISVLYFRKKCYWKFAKLTVLKVFHSLFFCHTLPQPTAQTHLELLIILEKQVFQPQGKKRKEILI
jgi:hypothetical protein